MFQIIISITVYFVAFAINTNRSLTITTLTDVSYLFVLFLYILTAIHHDRRNKVPRASPTQFTLICFPVLLSVMCSIQQSNLIGFVFIV